MSRPAPGGRIGLLWPSWITRNLGLTICARVPMSMGRAIAGVVLPLYLARAGYGPIELGILFVLVAVTSGVMSTAIGIGSDRVGRKPFMVWIPLLTGAAALALALSLNPVVIFVAASLGSFGRGGGAGGGTVGPYRPAEQALTTDSVSPQHRTSAFARLNFASSFGAVVGSLLIGALVQPIGRVGVLAGYRPEFLVIAVASIAAGLVGLALLEPSRRRSPTPLDRRRMPMLPRRSLPLLLRMWVVNGLNGAGVGLFGPFVAYWLYLRYGVGAGTIGDLFAVVNAATLGANLVASPLANRWGLVRTTTIFRVLQGLLLIPMVLMPTFILAGAIYTVRMMAQRVALPLRQSYVMAMADPEERGRVAAWSAVPSQVTTSAAPALAGALFAEGLLAAPFILGGLLQVISALAFFGFFRLQLPSEEETAPPLEAED